MRQFIRKALDAAALFIVVFAALYFSVQNIRIDGMSMHPTVVNEQHIIVSKLAYVRLNPAALKRFVPFSKNHTVMILSSCLNHRITAT